MDNLRNENNRLNNIILQLKSQIEMLVQENKNLKLQNSNILKTPSNGNESQEVLLLKEELENDDVRFNFIMNLFNKII